MDPLTIGLIAGGVGSLIRGIGGNRDARNTARVNTQEDARQEALARRRAMGRAALMRGIVDSAGYGATMTDDQMFDMLLRSPRRGANVVPSMLTGVGGGIANVGNLLVAGSANRSPTAATGAATDARSADWWEEFVDNVLNGGTAVPPPHGALPQQITLPNGRDTGY